MSTATRQLGRSLGGMALIAFVCAGLLAADGWREAKQCCPEAPLERTHGTVGLVLYQAKPGGRYQGLTGGYVLRMRLQGHHEWFRYEDDWPNYRSIKRAIRQHSVVDLGYANCRPAGFKSTDCDVFELAVGGGPRLTSAEEVVAERDRSSYRLAMWAAFAATIGVLTGLSGVFCLARAAAPAGAP